ncbi:MAG: carbon starvation protein A [Verrucomicrobiales bacterium]|jgi:carbon starvation protein|nr:carbon starvation protein A [Verrucomicrobiales bacterium]
MRGRNKRWSLPAWLTVGLVGLGCLSALAFNRGEQINALWLVVASLCVFMLAYRFHSVWLLAKVLTIDEQRATPAVLREDGRDFVPTNRWVVFGHHFAAIAGPGPLVGPVLAAQFGFLPGMLWILIGATLGGAVHDTVVLFCSIRRGGRSLGEMVRAEVGPFAGAVTLVSVLAIMVMILAVLGLVVVKALAESSWGLFTIAATMPLALMMGMAMKFRWANMVTVSVVGVAGLALSVIGGKWIQGTGAETWFHFPGTTLAWLIMGYGLLASVLPVWLLLAPRDYLSSFLKIGAVGFLAVAIALIAPTLQMPAVTRFVNGSGPVFAGPVFPFCFITIACGAVSGFHAIIGSGTTPKLLARKRDLRLVGYGAMITEMLVGIMALIAACVMSPGEYFAINMKGAAADVVAQVTALGFPVTEEQRRNLAAAVGEHTRFGRSGGAPTFAVGMAQMFSRLVSHPTAVALWYHFAIMFEALFILTTIDAGTRVGRFLTQDLLGRVWKPLGNTGSMLGSWLASVLFVGAWGWFLYQGVIDPLGGVNSFWPIFGVANQLLAVIALSLGTTVLLKMGKARYCWVTALPLGWLLAVTMSAGWMKIFAADSRLGFLSAARELGEKLTVSGTAEQVAVWQRLMMNHYINAAVTALFLVLVMLIVAANAWVWWRLTVGKRTLPLREDEYVALPR